MESKKLTLSQINTHADLLGVPSVALRAVIEVECKGKGFQQDGQPSILFERHVFKQRLIANGRTSTAKKAESERPDLCNSKRGGYGPTSTQHRRMQAAAIYHRESALEAASWGIGQVMGYQWKHLGYPSLQDFINAMYRDENAQLEAMCRFIKVRGLINALKTANWSVFALGYNGSAFAEHHYHTRLATAYEKLIGNHQHETALT